MVNASPPFSCKYRYLIFAGTFLVIESVGIGDAFWTSPELPLLPPKSCMFISSDIPSCPTPPLGCSAFPVHSNWIHTECGGWAECHQRIGSEDKRPAFLFPNPIRFFPKQMEKEKESWLWQVSPFFLQKIRCKEVHLITLQNIRCKKVAPVCRTLVILCAPWDFWWASGGLKIQETGMDGPLSLY